MADFERLGLQEDIIRALIDENWSVPTSCQEEAIPVILGGRHVCVSSETGTGKTGAFALPCLQLVSEHKHKSKSKIDLSSSNSAKNSISYNHSSNIRINDSCVSCTPSKQRQYVVWNVPFQKEQYMFEIRVIYYSNLRIGLTLDTRQINMLGEYLKSYAYDCQGILYSEGLPARNQVNVISCYVDRQARTVEFAIDGQRGKNKIYLHTSLKGLPLYPVVQGTSFKIDYNFDGPFKYPLPGFLSNHSPQSNKEPDNVLPQTFEAYTPQKGPVCLVFEPTKDLAQQTFDVMSRFSKYTDNPPLKLELCVGNSPNTKPKNIDFTKTDIVIGTLMKLLSLAESSMSLDSLKLIVMDEADELISQDSKNDLINLIKKYKKKLSLQVLFFSATLHKEEVRSAIDKMEIDPIWIDLRGSFSIPQTVHCVAYLIDCLNETLPTNFHETHVLKNIIPTTDGIHDSDANSSANNRMSYFSKIVKPQLAAYIADKFHMDSCLIFCRTNLDCNNLENYFNQLGGGTKFNKLSTTKENPYSCVVMAGLRSQEEREKNLAVIHHFKRGDIRFLICTDVAARGIDIDSLGFVLMLSLPEDPSLFFHRIGRVGRSDKMGLSILIISDHKEKVWYHTCRNRGQGCHNKELIQKGGCCKWFDEPLYLKNIEALLGHKIHTMDPKNLLVEGIIEFSSYKTTNQESIVTRKQRLAGNANSLQEYSISGSLAIYGKSQDDATLKTLNYSEQLTSNTIQQVIQWKNYLQDKFFHL